MKALAHATGSFARAFVLSAIHHPTWPLPSRVVSSLFSGSDTRSSKRTERRSRVHMALRAILGDYEAFVASILASLSALSVDVSRYQLDHVCYRVATNERYAEKKRELAAVAQLLLENDVAGRPIAVFRLHSPLVAEVCVLYA